MVQYIDVGKFICLEICIAQAIELPRLRFASLLSASRVERQRIEAQGT